MFEGMVLMVAASGWVPSAAPILRTPGDEWSTLIVRCMLGPISACCCVSQLSVPVRVAKSIRVCGALLDQ